MLMENKNDILGSLATALSPFLNRASFFSLVANLHLSVILTPLKNCLKSPV